MYTIVIIIVTAIISLAAFSDRNLFNRFVFYPFVMKHHPAEYYRMLSSGFIHADWMHLMFNMVSLFFFGSLMENICSQIASHEIYLVLYLSGIVISSLPSYSKHVEHSYYRSLGASGGVSAVLFATIYYYPWENICLYFAICIPSILYAVLYLVYTWYMSKRSGDNINHDAHLWGSVYGFLFSYVLDIKITHGHSFIDQIISKFH
jgi:membrane associated rhomboid family serine protease